jgi:beta-xylosidase
MYILCSKAVKVTCSILTGGNSIIKETMYLMKFSLLKNNRRRQIWTKHLPLQMFVLSSMLIVSSVYAQNPIIQTKYTADAAPMVYNDTVYLYTGHDEDNAFGFEMRDWLLYTSTDMVNWTDHGAVASLKNFKWVNTDNGAWAAQCVHRNGKFYLYCPVPNGLGIGVLVSDSPYGPFKDPIGKPLIKNGPQDIDPTVLIDDD